MQYETCLFDQGSGDKQPPYLPGILHGLAPNSSSFATHTILRAGTFQSITGFPPNKTGSSPASTLSIKHYPWNSEDVSMFGNRTLDPRAHDFVAATERFAAHITARYPLAAIIGADVSLPKVTKVEGASEKSFVIMTLQVRWDRAIGVLAAILGGEILAVVGLLGWCWWKGVMVRDHASYLSVANLMGPALQKAAGVTEIRSVDTGVEIARKMEKWGMARLRYRAVTRADGCLEVSLLDRGVQASLDNGRFRDGRYH